MAILSYHSISWGNWASDYGAAYAAAYGTCLLALERVTTRAYSFKTAVTAYAICCCQKQCIVGAVKASRQR